MIGKVAVIPLKKIKQISVYINDKRQTMADIKKALACDYIINAGLFNMTTFKPVNWLVSGGKILSIGGNPYGYALNGKSITFSYENNVKATDFIGAYPPLVMSSEKAFTGTPAGLTGERGRSAIGLTGDSLVMRCVPDLSNTDDYTLEELYADMKACGCINAINLDGGGSAQCDFNGQTITSSRTVHNFICVWVEKEDDKLKVAIDAGHGVETAGKCSPDKTYYEHEFNLDVAKRLKINLERCGFGVVMTRSDEHDVSLSDRCKIANDANADIFVSIHTNASGDNWSDAKGWQIHILGKGGNAEKLAGYIETESKSLGLTDRGIIVANYQVLRDTTMPAVLIEHGFHTNKDEVELLKSDSFRDKCAEADAKGICDYFGTTYIEQPPSTGKSISVNDLIAMGYTSITLGGG